MPTQPSFEEQFKALQTIVEQFERGDVPLSESLTLFKEGMTLVSALEKELKETEQTLETIEKDFSKGNEPPIEPQTETEEQS